MELTPPTNSSKKEKNYGTPVINQERLKATELEYFSAGTETNIDAKYALSSIKAFFFHVAPEHKSTTTAQTYKDKATRFIIAIQENDLDSLINEHFKTKLWQKTITTIQIPISQQTLDQLKNICASLQYREKLLVWLQKISNATKNTMETIYTLSKAQFAFETARDLIETTKLQIKHDEDPIKVQINFLKKALENVTTYKNGNGSIFVSDLYYQLNDRLKFLKLKAPHLLLEFGILLCNKINDLLKSLETKNHHLLSELTTSLKPYMIYMHNSMIEDSVPNYIKDEIAQHKNYALTKTLIYNMYNDNNYGPYCIEILFEIIAGSKDISFSIQRLANSLPHPGSFTAEERGYILFGLKRTQHIKPNAENLPFWYSRGGSTTASSQMMEIPLNNLTDAHIETNFSLDYNHDELNYNSTKHTSTSPLTKAQDLQILSNCLSTISSSQKSRLKTWIETGLILGEPEKTSDIDGIAIFFQDYVLNGIVKISEALEEEKAEDPEYSITFKEIGELQSAKLGKTGIPKGKEESVRKLTYIFNLPIPQRFFTKILKTIFYVIDSVQYSTNINKVDGSSWLNPHYSEQEKAKSEDFDSSFYNTVTKNYEVMTSIRNICQRPAGFGKIFSNILGNTVGANYTTDEVSEVKNILSVMITKEFFGAGDKALKVASVNPVRYLIEDFVSDEEHKNNDLLNIASHETNSEPTIMNK